jgi:hypothetical protein
MAESSRQDLIRNAVLFLQDPKVCIDRTGGERR